MAENKSFNDFTSNTISTKNTFQKSIEKALSSIEKLLSCSSVNLVFEYNKQQVFNSGSHKVPQELLTGLEDKLDTRNEVNVFTREALDLADHSFFDSVVILPINLDKASPLLFVFFRGTRDFNELHLASSKDLIEELIQAQYSFKSEAKDILNLEEELTLYRLSEEDNSYGAWLINLNTNRVLWSNEAYHIHGLPLSSTMNRGVLLEGYNQKDRDKIERALSQAKHRGKPFDLICRHVSKEGVLKSIRITGKRTHDDKGQTILAGSFQDITAVQRHNSKYEGIFNSTTTFIGFLDIDGTLLEANDTALNLANLKREDVVGKKFWDCYWWQISKRTRNRLKQSINEVIENGEPISYEVQVWLAQETPTTILFSLKPIHDAYGNLLYIIPEGRPIQDVVDNRNRYRNVIKSVEIGTWEWDLRTKQITYNDQWIEIIGRDMSNISDQTLEGLKTRIHDEDVHDFVRAVDRHLDGESEDIFVEVRMRGREKGQYEWIEIRGRVLYKNAKGESLKLYGTAQNISKRKESEKELQISEKAFRSNFENAAIGMALISEEGEWIEVNDQVSKILGYSRRELKALTFQDITHPEDLEKDLNLLRDLIADKITHYQLEKRYLHKSGSIVHALLAVSVVRDGDGNILHFISQIVDMTELKKALSELEDKNIQLEQFAHIAAHDMQQPLRTITNYLSLFQRKYDDTLEEKASMYIENAMEGALKMKNLINGILDFSKTNVTQKRKVNLTEVLNRIKKNIESESESKVNIHFDNLPTFKADGALLEQLFKNLIENGVKYQEKDTIPVVDISVIEKEDCFQFTIADNGIGMPEEYYSKVFEVFKRLHTHSEYPGSGIGLATCRRIVDAYDGDIWIEKNQPKGLKFIFVLPKSTLL